MSRRMPGFQGFHGSVDSIVRQRLREFRGRGFNDLGIFRVVSSRSREYGKYDSLYRKRKTCTDQIMPALIEGTRHHRRKKNMMEKMSKRNYIIGVREPIGGDRSPRR